MWPGTHKTKQYKTEIKKLFSFTSTQLKLALIKEIKELAKGNRNNSRSLMDSIFGSKLQDYDFLILYCIDISFSSNLTEVMGEKSLLIQSN